MSVMKSSPWQERISVSAGLRSPVVEADGRLPDVAVVPLQQDLRAMADVDPPALPPKPQLPVERVRRVVLRTLAARAARTPEEADTHPDVGGALGVELGGKRPLEQGPQPPRPGLDAGRGGGLWLGGDERRGDGGGGWCRVRRFSLVLPGQSRTLASLGGHGGQTDADAVRVDGPGDVDLPGRHGLPHRDAGVGVSGDFQEEAAAGRSQEIDCGRFVRGRNGTSAPRLAVWRFCHVGALVNKQQNTLDCSF